MQISHKYKFIFFSFPKTGSESVRELLDPYSEIRGIPFWESTEQNPFYSHISPGEVKALFKKNGWDYNEYYKFTFVRNPWARLVSLYNMIYHTNPPMTLTGKIRKYLGSLKKPTFKKWLLKTKNKGVGAGGPPDQRWQVYGSYSIDNYILDENSDELVDEVIKLEEIELKLPALLKKIGIPDAENLTIPYTNKRKSRSYTEYYDRDSIAFIETQYQYDINRFDYTYNKP